MAPTRASLLFCFLPPPLRGGSPISSREAGPCRQSEVLQPCLQASGMESLSWLPMFMPSAEAPGGPGPITNQGLRGAPPPRGHRLAPPLQVGVLSDPCSPLGAAVPFLSPHWNPVWVCVLGLHHREGQPGLWFCLHYGLSVWQSLGWPLPVSVV